MPGVDKMENNNGKIDVKTVNPMLQSQQIKETKGEGVGYSTGVNTSQNSTTRYFNTPVKIQTE